MLARSPACARRRWWAGRIPDWGEVPVAFLAADASVDDGRADRLLQIPDGRLQGAAGDPRSSMRCPGTPWEKWRSTSCPPDGLAAGGEHRLSIPAIKSGVMKTYLGDRILPATTETPGSPRSSRLRRGSSISAPPASWRGHDGLGLIEGRSRAAEKIAVDQPFSYPAPCMRWFLGQAGSRCRERSLHLAAHRCSRWPSASPISASPRNRPAGQPLLDLLAGRGAGQPFGVAREAVCAGKGRLIETHPGSPGRW